MEMKQDGISKVFFTGKLLTVLALMFCFSSVFAANFSQAKNVPGNPFDSTASAITDSTDDTSLTKAKYDKIKGDMTYKQVVAIIGSEGVEMSSTFVGKTRIVTYKWKGAENEYIFCNFTNNKLTFKSQANLK
jgi:hypothetical protein